MYDGDCETGFDHENNVVAGASARFLNLFFLADYAQCPMAQELALHKLIAVLAKETASNITNTIEIAYKHNIPSSDIGKNLKALLLDEAVTRAEDLFKLDEFNELLELGGAFAREFVQALREHHKGSNANKMVAKQMGMTSLSCFCRRCRFSFIIPSRSAGFNVTPKCPSCSDGARTHSESHVAVWTCPSATCDYTFYAAPLSKASTTFTCPKCTYVGLPNEWKVHAG